MNEIKLLKSLIIFMLIILITLSVSPLVTYSVSTSYQEVNYCFYGIYGYIRFPEEAKVEDLVNFEIAINAGVDLILNLFSFTVYAFVNGTWVTLYEGILVSNISLRGGEFITRNIEIKIPKNTSGRLTIVVESLTTIYGITACGLTLFNATYIRDLTYEELSLKLRELEKEYEDILQSLTQLSNEYQQLKSEYEALVKQYNKLEENHTLLTENYESLQIKYKELNRNYENLRKEFNDLLNSFTRLSEEKAVLEQNLTNMLTKYKKLLSDYVLLEDELKKFKEMCNETSYKYEVVKKELNDFKLKHNKLKSNYSKLYDEFIELKANYYSALNELSIYKYGLYMLLFAVIVLVIILILRPYLKVVIKK